MKQRILKQRPSRLQARRRESQVYVPETAYEFHGNPDGTDYCPRCPGRMIQAGKSYLALKCNGLKPSRDYPAGVDPCGYLRKTL